MLRVFRFKGVEDYNEVGSGSPLAADGGYRIAGLQPGTYRMAFDAAPGKYRSEYWTDPHSLRTALDVVIRGTQSVTGLDATAGPGACSPQHASTDDLGALG